MLLYSRRVSFNNLYPTYIDPSNPVHVPPQCKDELEKQDGKSKFIDLNFGFGGATINNIEQHYTRQSSSNQTKRKIPKLPPPPSKSILKKMKYNGEINYTISKDYNDPHQSAILSEDDDDEDEDEEEEEDDLPTTPPLVPLKPRRKSFADMTDAELLALEESYTTKSTLNIDSFNFNNTPTTFISPLETKNPKGSSGVSVAASTTTSTLGVDKPYPSRPVVEHGACCISSKHQDYDKYFNSDCNRVLLTCITGRRHTWSAIDYMINEIAIDGDHIVVTSHIPIFETKEAIKHLGNKQSEREFESSKSYNVSSSLIYQKCQNILDYVIKLTTAKRLNLKISVEIINCKSSKEVFNDSLKLYRPHLIIVGSKTDDDSLNRVMSVSSGSSNNDLEAKRPSLPRKNSSTVSTLGKGYNGYYKVSGIKCMKLTSYMIKHSDVPVVVVTNGYSFAKVKFRSPFEEQTDDTEDEVDAITREYYKKKLINVSDMSRTKSINDITQMNNLKRVPSNGSSICSSEEYPKPYGPSLTSPTIKVTFGDDLGFANGHSMYKVKSLLDPVDNMGNSLSHTRSSNSNSGGSINDKKKKERSKSDGYTPDSNSMAKLGISFKKFGFGKKK